MKTVGFALGLVAAATLTGCVWFEPPTDLATIKSFDDGTKMLASSNLGVAWRAPAGARSEGGDKTHVQISWGASPINYLIVNAKTDTSPTTLEEKRIDLDARLEGFRVLKSESFEGGHELTYNYRNKQLEKRIGYYSFRTVEGKTYECFLSSGWSSMDTVREAKTLCESLKPYAAPAAKEHQTATR